MIASGSGLIPPSMRIPPGIAAAATRPTVLRVEHLDEPLGIHTTSPRLSWQLPSGSPHQLGYRIRTDNGWDTGRVDSADNVLVPYAGPTLTSRQRVSWQVKVWTGGGESAWSDPATFELGLLEAADWCADWVRPAEVDTRAAGNRPASLLRRAFELDKPITSARLWITALGTYEAFLNGDRIGDGRADARLHPVRRPPPGADATTSPH